MRVFKTTTIFVFNGFFFSRIFDHIFIYVCYLVVKVLLSFSLFVQFISFIPLHIYHSMNLYIEKSAKV